MSKREQLKEYFSQSLEVELLLRLCPDDEDTIYQIVDLLVDTCATNRKLLRIAGDDKPAEVVRSRFMKLNADHMLNQANGDRQILAKQLNISTHQLSYVTHSGEGEGLLFFGNMILPFVDHFPKDLELYRILTTRLSEVAEAQKHE